VADGCLLPGAGIVAGGHDEADESNETAVAWTRRWLLLLLSVEKAVQHVFVTWAFTADRFREQVVVPHELLLVIGGISAVLFAVAAVGLWNHRRWAPPLLIGLSSWTSWVSSSRRAL
jgi:hypothetical protein